MRKWKKIEAAALAAVMAFPMTPVYHGVEVKAGKVSVMDITTDLENRKQELKNEKTFEADYKVGSAHFMIEKPAGDNEANNRLYVHYMGTSDGNVEYPSVSDVKARAKEDDDLKNFFNVDQFPVIAATNSRYKDGNYRNVKKVTIPDKYQVAGQFLSDTGVKELNIVGKDCTLDCWSGVFAHNNSLEKIEIDAKKVKLPPNAFTECKNLKNITINAGDTEVYSWGEHVSTGLNSLQNVTFNCKTTFNCEDGFISGVESKFNAYFDQYVKSNQMVFTKCKLGSVNIKGENNEIGKNFLSDCGEVDSVNIDNTTYLGTTAFYNTKIDDFSINAKTKFDNETFTSSSANNMYVNVDADGNNPELSHVKGEKGSGIAKNSKICNLYFNYANLNGIKTGIVTGLNRFPLGNTEETSIDCDNIYFCNPDFKYVGLSDYKAFKTKTKVYAYGGALSYNIDETITSSTDMFNEWLKDANCEFVNFVKVSDTDIRLKKATFETKTDSIDVDFSSEDTIEVSAKYATDKNDQYADIEKIDKTKKLDMITGSKVSTNFNYRILEKTPDSGFSKEKYNCQFKGQWYTPMTEKKKTLTVGKHEFLVEVAGQKYPFTIEVKKVVEEVAKPTATPVADGKSTKEPTATQAPKTDATQAPGASPDGSPSVVSSPAVTVDPEEVKNITNIRVEYKDKKAYEYSKISTAPEKLFVYVTENGKEELLRSNAQVQLSDYEILAGKVTTIDVTYKGIKASNSIKITGEADTLEYLVNVEYKGKTTVGTKVELKDIRVTAKMKSGNIIDSALNPTMLNEIKINSLTISEGENLLKVTFRDEEKIFDVMAASSSSVTTGDNSDNKLPNENVEKAQLKKGNEFTKNNIIYKVVSINGFTGNVSIVGYRKKTSKITLKSKITKDGYTFNVTTIEKNAFKNCKVLKGTIVIPNTITKIDNCAFYGCKNIKKLKLGKQTKKIGSKAFYGCKNLVEVDASKALKITSIGKSAFKNVSIKLRFSVSKKTSNKIRNLLRNSVM